MSSSLQSAFTIITDNASVSLYVAPNEDIAVMEAFDCFQRDLEAVFHCKVNVVHSWKDANIVIGTLQNRHFVEHLEEVELNLAKLHDENGNYRWEGFLHEVKNEQLFIAGTDRRGTIYGMYDLSEEVGVSPWYYWADVPIKKKKEWVLSQDYMKYDWPSVQYRGIFINDEEELEVWSKLHTTDGTIGPTTYRHLFELILRLKGNYIWPAMHVNYFNENPENNALAHQMGIVVGTSHCDMLLRSNQNEWQPWIESKGNDDAVYDYSIEGENREILKQYWRESIQYNQQYEVSYTLGMRGIHDSGFHTEAIDHNEQLTVEQKAKARVALLQQVVEDQRELLAQVLGEQAKRDVLQTFVPYKEVLTLYDQGLELPEDVTLIWANDNYGHIRRYPTSQERNRRGGNGLYFHSSYWAPPGSAMSFLFINSIPLAHTGNELKKAYEAGMRKLWVQNIGGLKPLEQDMEFFIKYGWDAGKKHNTTTNATTFTTQWINRNFTGNYGQQVALLYETYAQVTNVRKVEHMNNHVFSQYHYGDEAARRIHKLKQIYEQGNIIWRSLPEEEQSAFFQLVLMKIHAAYYTNLEYYYADRSIYSYEQGRMQAADHYSKLSLVMSDYLRKMIYYYNTRMSDGKWNGMMTPRTFSPPPTAIYPARQAALAIKGSGLHVTLWNKQQQLTFDRYGKKKKWIELGNLGSGSIPFEIKVRTGTDWLRLTQITGIVQTDLRIGVECVLDKYAVDEIGLIEIHDMRNGELYEVEVIVQQAFQLPSNFNGYIEADGYIAMASSQYQLSVGNEYGCWEVIPCLARYEGNALMVKCLEYADSTCDSVDELQLHKLPYVQYDFYTTSSGEFQLEIIRNLTLNAKGKIRFAAVVDEHEPIIIESYTIDEKLANWTDSIFNDGERLYITLPYVDAGAHQIKLYAIDRYVTLSKLIIYTIERKQSQLAPELSYCTLLANHALSSADVELMPLVNWNDVEQIDFAHYMSHPEDHLLENVLFTDREFYEQIDRQVYELVALQARNELGEPIYEQFQAETNDKNIVSTFGEGKFQEKNGMIAIEAEYALENSAHAYLTPSSDSPQMNWTHLQAETNGRTGLAMHVAEPKQLWEQPVYAPKMNYEIKVHQAGLYHVWLLVRYYNKYSDSCVIGLNHQFQPISEQFNKGSLFTYNTEQSYFWCHLSDLHICEGEHTFTIAARKSELRVDRIYLTIGDELPPIDKYWKVSERSL